MLSSQFNSGYRHQLTIKPLVKGFFDTFIFSSYPNRTTFCFGSFKNRVGERKILALSKIVLVREKTKQERRR